MACLVLPPGGRCWNGGQEEEGRLPSVRVIFRKPDGRVISEPTPPRPIYIRPPGGADLSREPDENERFSLCAAAARVDGRAVHVKAGALEHPRHARRDVCSAGQLRADHLWGRLIEHVGGPVARLLPPSDTFAGRSLAAANSVRPQLCERSHKSKARFSTPNSVR